jgi:hypothetical protein
LLAIPLQLLLDSVPRLVLRALVDSSALRVASKLLLALSSQRVDRRRARLSQCGKARRLR